MKTKTNHYKKLLLQKLASAAKLNELTPVFVQMKSNILTAAPGGGCCYRTEMVELDRIPELIEAGWTLILRNQPASEVMPMGPEYLRADI